MNDNYVMKINHLLEYADEDLLDLVYEILIKSVSDNLTLKERQQIFEL